MSENKELKFTYILGAGASANALAMVNGMPNAFRALATQLSSPEFTEGIGLKDEEDDIVNTIEDLCDNLKEIAAKTDEYGTPDTYAKYLYLKEDYNELIKLKWTLSAYFIIEQVFNKKFEQRALIFLTTILQQLAFPNNIKILTWNYDFQIELAAEYFLRGLIPYYPFLGNVNNQIDNLSLIHLNGIAGFYKESVNNLKVIKNTYFDINDHTYFDTAVKIKTIFSIMSNKLENFKRGNLLSFAWEDNSKAVTLAKQAINDTDFLIVIGYSFPFFNRIIDKEIMNTLKESTKLKMIYYQDPYKAGDFLRNQFELPDNIKIKHIQNGGNYFIPTEM